MRTAPNTPAAARGGDGGRCRRAAPGPDRRRRPRTPPGPARSGWPRPRWRRAAPARGSSRRRRSAAGRRRGHRRRSASRPGRRPRPPVRRPPPAGASRRRSRLRRAPSYTQAVRTMCASGIAASTASSPASLVRPYTPSGPVSSSISYGRSLSAGEHVVGGDVDEVCAGTRAGLRDVLGPDGVDGVGPLLVVFGGVDLGVGRAVDHDVTGLDEPLGRRRVGDIPLRRRQRQHVAALPTRLSCQGAPHHATGAGDNDSV